MLAPITKIKYLNKSVQEISGGSDGVEVTAITYEIDADGMMMLAAFQNDSGFEVRRIFFYEEGNNIIDLVVDNIPNGQILHGGIKDGKFMVTFYKVYEGLEKLLEILQN